MMLDIVQVSLFTSHFSSPLAVPHHEGLDIGPPPGLANKPPPRSGQETPGLGKAYVTTTVVAQLLKTSRSFRSWNGPDELNLRVPLLKS